jgi:hypothetical protein
VSPASWPRVALNWACWAAMPLLSAAWSLRSCSMVLRTVWVPVWVMAGLAFDGAVLAGGAKTLLWEFVID